MGLCTGRVDRRVMWWITPLIRGNWAAVVVGCGSNPVIFTELNHCSLANVYGIHLCPAPSGDSQEGPKT